MSDKQPSLADEIQQARKPRLNVSLPPRQEIPDETIEARSHMIGEKWGSSSKSSREAGDTLSTACQRALRLSRLSGRGVGGKGCRHARAKRGQGDKDLSHPAGS